MLILCLQSFGGASAKSREALSTLEIDKRKTGASSPFRCTSLGEWCPYLWSNHTNGRYAIVPIVKPFRGAFAISYVKEERMQRMPKP